MVYTHWEHGLTLVLERWGSLSSDNHDNNIKDLWMLWSDLFLIIINNQNGPQDLVTGAQYIRQKSFPSYI